MTPRAYVLWFLLVLPFNDAPPEPGFRIHKRVSEVQLTVVAEDTTGHTMRELRSDQISLQQDGRSIDNFTLRSANDLPLRLGIVIDLSGSTAVTWQQVRESLLASMQQLVRPEDQVMLVTFNRKIELERTVERPADLTQLLPIRDTGGLTALYDSVFQTCSEGEFFNDDHPRHSALILFSDGEDNLSLRGLGETIARAQQTGISIYAVTMHGRKVFHYGDGILERLSGSTGGRAFVVTNRPRLQAALATINEELRSAYVVNFRPLDESDKPGFHQVDIAPAPGVQLRLRARAGYYSTP